MLARISCTFKIKIRPLSPKYTLLSYLVRDHYLLKHMIFTVLWLGSPPWNNLASIFTLLIFIDTSKEILMKFLNFLHCLHNAFVEIDVLFFWKKREKRKETEEEKKKQSFHIKYWDGLQPVIIQKKKNKLILNLKSFDTSWWNSNKCRPRSDCPVGQADLCYSTSVQLYRIITVSRGDSNCFQIHFNLFLCKIPKSGF